MNDRNHVVVDYAYFSWLYARIKSREGSTKDIRLCEHLFQKEFEFFVPNDHNRAQDGLELRSIFASGYKYGIEDDWFELPCSLFEMFVALASRTAYISKRSKRFWFWLMMENLGVRDQEYSHDNLEAVFTKVVERTYDKNGFGGIFPLRNSKIDQTKVELWYQMSAYLLENNY